MAVRLLATMSSRTPEESNRTATPLELLRPDLRGSLAQASSTMRRLLVEGRASDGFVAVQKYLAGSDRPAVERETRGTNQRGLVTCPGHATVLLPSREHCPVGLPDPPADHGASLQATLEAIAERPDHT